MTRHVWFRAKTYGWGWTPVTWQGWVVLIVYLILLGMVILPIRNAYYPDRYLTIILLPSFVILTGFLIMFCSVTGEKPHWQWGQKKK